MTVHYRDGSTEVVVCDQYSLSMWERWAVRTGLPFDPQSPGRTALTQMRVMAWAALQRDAAVKVSFDAWDATVQGVDGGDPDEVDPTTPATSAG
jgi:2-hydroxychromene-2-carboxylate isomerase